MYVKKTHLNQENKHSFDRGSKTCYLHHALVSLCSHLWATSCDSYSYLKRGFMFGMQVTKTAACMQRSRLSTMNQHRQPLKQTAWWCHWKRCLIESWRDCCPNMHALFFSRVWHNSTHSHLGAAEGYRHCWLLSRDVGTVRTFMAMNHYKPKFEASTGNSFKSWI